MADMWSHIRTWWLVLPPSRPADWQLSRIRHEIDDLDRASPVGVLGSTPEFRDLLHELGFTRVLVFERNRDFHREVSKLRVYQNTETLVEGDWLDTLGDKRGELSLILSDLTSGNVPYDRRGEFYNLIGKALAKDGLFIDKILRHTGTLLRVDDLFTKYAMLPINLLHVNQFSCEMLFASELLDLAEVVDSSRFYDILDERSISARLRAFACYAKDITPPGCVWYYGRRWENLEREYCPSLRVRSAVQDEPGSPYSRYLSLMVHERP